MTIQEVNDIFKTKYPDGEIIQRGCFGGASKVSVTVIFKPNTKCYSYNVDNYAQLLNKLGFSTLYKENIPMMQKQLAEWKEVIKNNGEESHFFGFIELKPERKEVLLQYIQDYEEQLKNSIIVSKH